MAVPVTPTRSTPNRPPPPQPLAPIRPFQRPCPAPALSNTCHRPRAPCTNPRSPPPRPTPRRPHPPPTHRPAAAQAPPGRPPAGGDQELLTDDPRGLPTLGSAVSYALGPRAHALPYVALPYTLYNVVQLPGQTPGLLGGAYDRFQVVGDPSAADFRVAAFDGAADLSGRAALLSRLERAPLPGPAARATAYRDRALRLLASAEVRALFELGREPPRLRERYGLRRLGQSLLLARRLVEGGVNFVAVFDGQTN